MVVKKLKGDDFVSIVLFLIAIVGAYFFVIPNDNRDTYILYIGIIMLSLAFALISELSINGYSGLFFGGALFVVAYLMAFRNQTGIDDWNYKEIFIAYQNKGTLYYFNKNSELEIGFLLLNRIGYFVFGGNYNKFQVFVVYITFILWGKAFKQFGNYTNFTVFLLFMWSHYYFIMMGAALIRIFIALPIVMYSIRYLIEGKKRNYIITVIIASLFHLSALFMLFFLVIFIQRSWIENHWKRLAIFAGIGVGLGISFAIKFFVPILGERYIQYLSVGNFQLSLASFDTLPIIIIGCLYLNKIEKNKRKLYVIGLILAIVGLTISIFTSVFQMGRLVYYTNIGNLIMISMIFKRRKYSKYDVFTKSILILYSVIYLLYTSLTNDFYKKNLYPYIPFFK